MVGTTLDYNQVLSDKDSLAVAITNTYVNWNLQRQPWLAEVNEIRNYVFATDTTTTSNKILPWKNTTTLPKLCQIRDNLHANYMAALFPHADWLTWEGHDQDSQAIDKRLAITSFMDNKLKQCKFRTFFSKLVYDYIDYGNVFTTARWCYDVEQDPEDGYPTINYIGALPVRISPLDIVFNPTATTFEDSPKIIRSLKSMGEIKKETLQPDNKDAKALFDLSINRAINDRRVFSALSVEDKNKIDEFAIDGFGTLTAYYGSGYVEVLQFFGTIYDMYDDILYEDYVITIIDRRYILKKEKNPSWLKNNIIHAGWRLRPDNLYAMSPLSNLIGMQYRIDHLENLKADVFDMIAFPVLKIKGNVDDFEYAPNARVYVGDEGDVEFMHPDVTALSADVQIDKLEARMEEMAGAPKQSMGFRTPGEKTAFEVQLLDNNASRIFVNKVSYLEEMAEEPLINLMLELARRNMTESDLIRTLDNDLNVVTFTKITKEDLKANGKIIPTGAAHFARKNNLIQNLTNLASSAIGQDPAVNVHMSGLKTAKLIENLMDIEKYGLVSPNIRVTEQADTQRLMAAAQHQTQVESLTPPGVNPADNPNNNPATVATAANAVRPHPELPPQFPVPGSAASSRTNRQVVRGF